MKDSRCERLMRLSSTPLTIANAEHVLECLEELSPVDNDPPWYKEAYACYYHSPIIRALKWFSNRID